MKEDYTSLFKENEAAVKKLNLKTVELEKDMIES